MVLSRRFLEVLELFFARLWNFIIDFDFRGSKTHKQPLGPQSSKKHP
jgi:hypothetical protein